MYILKALCDSAKPCQYGYQDPATPIIRGIIHLHNNIIFFLIIILCLVCWLLFRTIFKFRAEKNKFSYKDFTHSTPLEIGWTLSPALLLICLSSVVGIPLDKWAKIPPKTQEVIRKLWARYLELLEKGRDGSLTIGEAREILEIIRKLLLLSQLYNNFLPSDAAKDLRIASKTLRQILYGRWWWIH